MSAVAGELRKVRSSMMNAVHDLPLLVAHDEGFFRDEGLDVEILKTLGRVSTHQIIAHCATISSSVRWKKFTNRGNATNFACASGA